MALTSHSGLEWRDGVLWAMGGFGKFGDYSVRSTKISKTDFVSNFHNPRSPFDRNSTQAGRIFAFSTNFK